MQASKMLVLWVLLSATTSAGSEGAEPLCPPPSDRVPGHAAVHLFNLTGAPDPNVLANFRMMLSQNNQALLSKQRQEETLHRVQVMPRVQLLIGVSLVVAARPLPRI